MIGLTSATNSAFVRSLGFYDSVLTYDEIGALATVDSVIIDMAGNPTVLAAVHAHLNVRSDTRMFSVAFLLGRSGEGASVIG